MKDHDFHVPELAEYPWRIDIPIEKEGIQFSGASPDLTPEDAIRQGHILLKRFMAKKAVLTPIVVSRTMSKEKMEEIVARLTTTIENTEP